MSEFLTTEGDIRHVDATKRADANGIEVTDQDVANLRLQKRTVTVDEAALSGTSQAVNVGAVLPTNAVVLAHEIIVNEQGAGQSDLTITLGGTDADAIVASTDLDALAAGKYQGTLGVHPRGSFSAEQLVATFAATNLATLSAGNWTFNVWFVVIA